jgi:uncharacterized protein with HEPN domain
MKSEYEDYLRDMLENAEKALPFVQGMDYDGFYTDDKAVYAVIRALEIIGGGLLAKSLKIFVNQTLKSSGVKSLPCATS